LKDEERDPKENMKEICPSNAKTSSKSETSKPKVQKCASLEKSSRSKDDISKTERARKKESCFHHF
jgi:hypothetical protein